MGAAARRVRYSTGATELFLTHSYQSRGFSAVHGNSRGNGSIFFMCAPACDCEYDRDYLLVRWRSIVTWQCGTTAGSEAAPRPSLPARRCRRDGRLGRIALRTPLLQPPVEDSDLLLPGRDERRRVVGPRDGVVRAAQVAVVCPALQQRGMEEGRWY